MTDWLSLLAEQRRQEAEQLRAQQQEALMGMTQEPQLDMGQKLVTGLGALAPLIAGIIRGGKTGLQTGAALGMGVLQDMDRRRQDDMKFDTAIAKTKYDSATKSAEKAESQADKAEFEKAKLADREAKGDLAKHGKGTTVINVPGQQPVGLGEATSGKLSAAIDLTDKLVDAEMQITAELKGNPELAATWLDKDGNWSWEGIASLAEQSLKTGLVGNETPRGRVNAVVMGVVADVVKAASGLQYTDKQFEKYVEQIGKGNLPQSVPAMLRGIGDLRRRLEWAAQAQIRYAQNFKEKLTLEARLGGIEETRALRSQVRQQFFDEAKSAFGEEYANSLADTAIGRGSVAKGTEKALKYLEGDVPLSEALTDKASTVVDSIFSRTGNAEADAARARLRKTYVGQ